ncbi:MAG: cas6 [Clostridia bacterium]|nr:cas6 [Clostridia bacterium]
MRLKIEFDLKHESLISDYRRCFLSYIKKALEDYGGNEAREMFFKGQEPIVKPYTFSVMLPGAVFHEEKIQLSSKSIALYFSTYDFASAITFYNSFLKQKQIPFVLPDNNRMTMTRISSEKEKLIRKDTIKIRMMAPLCVREHSREGNKDNYYTFEDHNFEKRLREIIKWQIKHLPKLDQKIADTLTIKPLKARRTIVRYYGQLLDVSLGTFLLSADPLLLNYLYMEGIGSRRGSGFGMFDVI